MQPKDVLTKEYLEEHYIRQQKSINRIANELGLSSSNSVKQALDRHGLYREPLRQLKQKLTKEFLLKQYVELKKGMREISRSLGYQNKKAVKEALVKHGIPIRASGYIDNEKAIISLKKRRKGYKDINGNYWSTVVCSAQHREIPFEITIEYAWELYQKQNGKCAISGVPIRFKALGESQREQTASLDRINSSKAYTKDNVQWVHKVVQRMKHQFSQQELIYWCKIITQYNDNSILS